MRHQAFTNYVSHFVLSRRKCAGFHLLDMRGFHHPVSFSEDPNHELLRHDRIVLRRCYVLIELQCVVQVSLVSHHPVYSFNRRLLHPILLLLTNCGRYFFNYNYADYDQRSP